MSRASIGKTRSRESPAHGAVWWICILVAAAAYGVFNVLGHDPVLQGNVLKRYDVPGLSDLSFGRGETLVALGGSEKEPEEFVWSLDAIENRPRRVALGLKGVPTSPPRLGRDGGVIQAVADGYWAHGDLYRYKSIKAAEKIAGSETGAVALADRLGHYEVHDPKGVVLVDSSSEVSVRGEFDLEFSGNHLAFVSRAAGKSARQDVPNVDAVWILDTSERTPKPARLRLPAQDITTVALSAEGRFAAGTAGSVVYRFHARDGRYGAPVTLYAGGSVQALAFYDEASLIAADALSIRLLEESAPTRILAQGEEVRGVKLAVAARPPYVALGMSDRVIILRVEQGEAINAVGATSLALVPAALLIAMVAVFVGLGRRKRLAIMQSDGPQGPDPSAPTGIESPPLPLPEPPAELLQALIDGECILYAGAGLSAQAGFPTWSEFVGRLLEWARSKDLLGSPEENAPVVAQQGPDAESVFARLETALRHGQPDQVADIIVAILEKRRGGRKELSDFLGSTFLSGRASPSPTHLVLSRLPFVAAVTTNFDPLIERTYKGKGNLRASPNPSMARSKDVPVLTPRDLDDLRDAVAQGSFFVLKLYGTPERPDTVLLAPAQYVDAVSSNVPFASFIDSLFVTRTLFFIGASLEGVEAYLAGIPTRAGIARHHFALVDVTGTAWQAKADLLERRYNVKVLPFTASEGHPELKAFAERCAEGCGKLAEEIGAVQGDGGAVGRRDRPRELTRVRLGNIGPFADLELSLDKRWNIFLGDNGVGKTSILRAIAVGILGKEAEPFAGRLISSGQTSARILLEIGGREHLMEIKGLDDGAQINAATGSPMEAEGILAMGFPPLRSLTWAGRPAPSREAKGRPVPQDLLPLITGEPDPRLDKLKGWIVDLYARMQDEKVETGGPSRYERLLHRLFDVANLLTPGIKMALKKVDLVSRRITVTTDDGDVPIEALSQGTTSLIGWVGIILQRLYEVFPESEDPTHEYCLVLIDELDAHMHPEWQQTVVSHLEQVFPNAQFIATTHSPLIVAGRPAKQVQRFARDRDGKVSRLPIEEDMTMGRADQILTGRLFGLHDTLDVQTQLKIREYQALMGKARRSPEEERQLAEVRRVLGTRIPMDAQTPPERLAQELLHRLLEQQVGSPLSGKLPETGDRIMATAKRLFEEIKHSQETNR